MKNKKYLIGLDIGTNSIGWAVTDENYNLLKHKNKHMWGTRIFADDGETEGKKAERRGYRNARRRLSRRKLRIEQLRELLKNIFKNTDDANNFYTQLDESFYQLDDKSIKINGLFCDEENELYYLHSNDVQKRMHSQTRIAEENYLPTIYHLRKYLKSNVCYDPRLVYLAIHHIMKYRGNFIQVPQNIEDEDCEEIDLVADFQEIKASFVNLCDCEESNVLSFKLDKSDSDIVEFLKKNKSNKSGEHEEIVDKIASKDTSKINAHELLNLLYGYKVKLDNLFAPLGCEGLGDLTFSKDNSDKIEETLSKISDERIVDILLKCQNFYNNLAYVKNIGEYSSISDFMIAKYEQYNRDLKLLKKVLRENLEKEDYYDYFNTLSPSLIKSKKLFNKNNINYNYAHYTIQGGKCDYQNFQKTLKDILQKFQQNPIAKMKNEISDILGKLDKDEFLVKLRIGSNTIFPMSANLKELKEIIKKQNEQYPYLKEIRNQLLKLFSFKIDYFVGPLVENGKSEFSWLVKNEKFKDKTITYENYDQAIDLAKTQEHFILRMTRDCTYLLGEKALPANSIIYCRYKVLNEINNLRCIDNEVLSNDQREKIYNMTLTTSKKDVSIKNIKDRVCQYKELKVSGNEYLNNMRKSEYQMRSIFNITTNDEFDENLEMFEDLILWLTIFHDNPKVIKEKIKNKYPQIDDDKIKHILTLSYSGWGNLSKKLLTELKREENGQYKSIMDFLSDFKSDLSSNFMHAYTKYGFDEKVNEENKKYMDLHNISFEESVNEKPWPPHVRSGVNQAYKIVKEIIDVVGCDPEDIYIEFTRGEDKKKKGKKQKTRQKIMQEKYDAIKNNCLELQEWEKTQLKLEEEAQVKLDNNDCAKEFDEEKFMLYYMQNGKCAYSGKQLYLDKLSDYHVDHIVPQSLLKDDSFDNKVLVLPECNLKKADNEAVPEEYRDKMAGKWDLWHRAKLISAEKYYRLMRKEINDNTKKSFINRQITETSQIIKNTAVMLNDYFVSKRKKQDDKCVSIHVVKSELNSEFRKTFGYFKGNGGREINDFHHAKDAYISIFVGKHIDEIREKLKQKDCDFSPKNTGYYKKGFSLDPNYVMYNIGQKSEELKNFDKQYWYNDIYYTKKLSYGEGGKLYDATRYKSEANRKKFGNDDNIKLIPMKKNKNTRLDLDVTKYGGMSGQEFAYFGIVKSENAKGNVQYAFFGMPTYLLYKGKEQQKYEYLCSKDVVGTKYNINPIELNIKIHKNQLLYSPDRGYFRITGKGDRNMFVQLVFGAKYKELYEFIFHIYDDFKFFDKRQKRLLIIKEMLDTTNYEDLDKNQKYYYDKNKEYYENNQDWVDCDKEGYIELNTKKFVEVYKKHFEKNLIKFSPIKTQVEKIFDEFYYSDDIDKRKEMNQNNISHIKELLTLSKCKRANLNNVDNRITFTLKLSDLDIIYQSITGMRSRKCKLMSENN